MRAFWIIFLFVVGSFLTIGTPAYAWGAHGHLTICDLAYRNLTDASKEALKDLFQVSTGGITVKGRNGTTIRHYKAFNIGCLEEDERPRRNPKDHFLNVIRGLKAIKGGGCPGGTACILSGIERDRKILNDKTNSNEKRVFALMALGHWVGDIHQPLHVSFKDDRGGNSIEVKLKGKCGSAKRKPKNLHAVWDTCLLEAGLFERVREGSKYKKSWNKRSVTYAAVTTILAETTLTEEQKMIGTDPWKWAKESFKITRNPKVLYCFKVGKKCQYTKTAVKLHSGGKKRKVDLDQTYLADFERLAEERVKLAGFRLAHLINLALDENYKRPIQNSTQPD